MSVLVVQGRCDILGQGGRSAKTRVQKHFATSHQISARAAPRRSLRAAAWWQPRYAALDKIPFPVFIITKRLESTL